MTLFEEREEDETHTKNGNCDQVQPSNLQTNIDLLTESTLFEEIEEDGTHKKNGNSSGQVQPKITGKISLYKKKRTKVKENCLWVIAYNSHGIFFVDDLLTSESRVKATKV